MTLTDSLVCSSDLKTYTDSCTTLKQLVFEGSHAEFHVP